MHLDCWRVVLSVAAVEHFAVFCRPKRWPQLLVISGRVSVHDLYARLTGRDLGVAVKLSDYLGRPRFKRAIWQSARVQVDSAKREAVAEIAKLQTDATTATGDDFLGAHFCRRSGIPGAWVVCLSLTSAMRRVRHFRQLAVAFLVPPRDPA